MTRSRSLAAMAIVAAWAVFAPAAHALRVEPEKAVELSDAGAPRAQAQSRRAAKALAIDLPAPTGLELAQTRKPAKDGTPPVIGFPRDVEGADETRLHGRLEWETLPDGSLLAALSVTSPTASAVRVGLRVQSLPAGAVLRFLAPGDEALFEVTGQEILETIERNLAAGERGIEAREYWSPVIEAETLVMEVTLPPGARASDFRVGMPRISHLVTSARDDFAAPKAAASCTIDAACHTSTWGEEMNAVARMVFSSGGFSYLCTGTLLADADPSTAIPYFATANHCVGSQAVASTLQTYWFYRRASCGGGVNTYATRTGGATLLHATARADASFMRLNVAPPLGATFAGWIAGTPPVVGTDVTGLHHPTGDLLRISFGDVVGYVNCTSGGETFSCFGSTAPSSQYYAVRWRNGITEGGSSGSGLFLDGGRYLVGTLYGGSSSCTNPTGTDFYGRFDVTYNEVIRDWLGSAPAGNNRPTTTTLTSSLNPSTAGQSVTFTARVTAATGTPTGLVTFLAGSVPISGCAGVALSSGAATCTTSALARGTSTISATYSGTGDFGASATAGGLAQVVNGIATTLTMAVSATVALQNDPVTLTATVQGGTGAAEGSVTFRDGGSPIALCSSVPVVSRTATCTYWGFSVGVHMASASYSGDWRLSPSNSPQVEVNVVTPPPESKRLPQVGDFNGDGRADILWYLPDTSVSMWLMDGTAVRGAQVLTIPASGNFVEAVGETNGDRRADIFLGHWSANVDLWLMDGTAVVASPGILPAAHGTAVQVADFDGDGRSDILFKRSDGRIDMKLLRDTAVVAEGTLLAAGSPFLPVLTGDFNGDGKADIVWRHPDGRVIVWLMNGLQFIQSRTIFASGATSVPLFARDFDGDGRADLLVENADGSTSMLLMNGVEVTFSQVLQPAGSAWRVAQVGDLNADSRADILWRNVTYGNVVAWLMNGPGWTQSRTLRGANNEWRVTRVADFNADGRADILWTRASGLAEIWLMNGIDMLAQAALDPANPVISAPAPDALATATTLEMSPISGIAGQQLHFRATVTASSGTPTGAVEFTRDGVPIAGCLAVPLSAGVASCFAALPGGTSNLSARYLGAAGYLGSTSGNLAYSVARAPTTLAVAGPASSTAGGAATFTAVLSGGVAPITGSVMFLADGAAIAGCTVLLPATPSCAVATLGLGAHAITAEYSGDANNQPSASAPFAHTVGEAPPPPAGPRRAKVDFNGDGIEDIAWLRNGELRIWVMGPAGTRTEAVFFEGPQALLGDFNGDGKSDVLAYWPGGGAALLLMDGTTQVSRTALRAAGEGWAVQSAGDFNGDGKTDILWKHLDGRVEVTLMDAGTIVETRQLQPAGSLFFPARTADFNGDGKSDIVWTHNDGRVIAWLMDGVAFTASRTLQAVGGTGAIVHTADLDGDGKADVVWEYGDGGTQLALMDGLTVKSSAVAQAAGSNWRVARTGDLDGDGKADLAWRNVVYGNVVLWLMNGTSYTAARTVRGSNAQWSLALVRDFTGEGRGDLFWLDTGGASELWGMSGLDAAPALSYPSMGSGWTLVQ